jgi:hypothetical protein
LEGTAWYHRAVLPDGRAWPAFGRAGSNYVVRFEGACTFLIDPSGSVEARPDSGAGGETVRRLFLDQVIPLVLNLRGRECLHAGAVAIDGAVCAFAGPSGAGKSTLAAALAALGYPLVCDDCLALDDASGRVTVLPGHRGSKLWPDSAAALSVAPSTAVPGNAAKRLLISDLPSGGALPLRSIYLLVPSPAPVSIAPAGIHEAVPALVEAAFRLDLTDAAMLARQFQFLTRLVTRVPVRRLVYPHEFGALASVRDRILADLAAG